MLMLMDVVKVGGVGVVQLRWFGGVFLSGRPTKSQNWFKMVRLDGICDWCWFVKMSVR